MSIETVAVDVEHKLVHGIEDVVHVGSDLFKLLADAKTLSPQFKVELSTLIADIGPIATVLTPIIASDGDNVAADLAAVAPIFADLKKLASDFVAFLPILTKAIADVEADVQPVKSSA